MTQLELQLNPKFTLDTLVDTCAAFERDHGFPLKRLTLARSSYDELLKDLPLGAALYAAEHGLPIFNGVEIEVYGGPG